MRALGVTDALDADLADFSPLTENRNGLYLSKADHAAMLEIDENGVTGAAYTELGVSETAAEIPDDEIDFVLDRPFLFLVTGQDGSLLLSGVVRNIDGEVKKGVGLSDSFKIEELRVFHSPKRIFFTVFFSICKSS